MTPANAMLLPYTPTTFVSVAGRIVRGLDKGSLNAAYLVTLAECIDTQAGLMGAAAATEYMRCATVRSFCSPHPDDPTLWCLDQWLMLHCFSPGMFLTAHRDRPGCAYCVVMEECSRMAIASGAPLADPAKGYHMGAAREAALAFVNSDPPDELLIPPLTVLLPAGDRMSRMSAFVVRMTLASNGDDAGEAFRNVVANNLQDF